ncbi:MAG: PD40 domain-containing protein [Candidatus Aminicenantes bacterium]|nr:PD40 domain-containing protein [Candidatus Aminicenantes bacterium]
MKHIVRSKLFLFLIIAACPLLLSAVDTQNTRMLHQPAVSGSRIAFLYAGDLWTANIDGSNPRRLTSDEGIESNAHFSPDGKHIAFSAQYDGNTDVFIVPAEGGIPKRLTYHPFPDIVRGFTPDGKSVLFISNRSVFSNRHFELFTVSIDGGFPEKLSIPNAYYAVYSPGGTHLAYTPLGDRSQQWKRYRGGTTSEIWLYAFSDHSVEKIPQPEGRCNDTHPMWFNDRVYFRSDRNGEFNLFEYDYKAKKIRRLTSHEDFPVLNASAGDGKIAYDQAGYLHIFDPQTEKSTQLTIGIAAELLGLRPRYEQGSRYIRNGGISSTGVRAVFEYRGEIITVPAEKGDPRNIVQTPGIHERNPAWSPDGKSIAYFSDASGEYALHIAPQDGRGEVKTYPLDKEGHGFYYSPVWSPDGKKIAFTDNSWSLLWIDLDSGKVRTVGQEYHYGPGGESTIRPFWSPDSKWIAYDLNTSALFRRVYLSNTEEEKSYPITDGLSDASSPVFDKNGKYLYFFASTDAGPVKHWFAMSSADMEMTNSVYMAVLPKGEPSPLAKESDEEKAEEKKPEKEPKSKEEKKENTIKVDFDGIQYRILDLPIVRGPYLNLQAGSDGEIYFLESSPSPRGGYMIPDKLHLFKLKTRKDEVIGQGVLDYDISADRKKLLYRSRGGFSIVAAGQKIKPGDGRLNVNALQVRIEPLKEWKQIYNEAWRINRDYFYDPNFHGCDWKAMKEKYAQFLPHLAWREDLNLVIQWLCSELAVGHHRVAGGDSLDEPEGVPGGLLGADYTIENGRYRFAKIYGGLNWNPELRSPLTEPGVDVKQGEYILAVQGEDLKTPKNLFSLFENTAGKLINITVGPNPNGSGSRTVEVVPVQNEYSLRNRDWVEGNIKKVHEATAGRVAYVYVPNTSTLGHTYFKRYFFPQSKKEAIIVDERFNGGGLLADYYIDILRRPGQVCYWNTRYGHDYKTPSASIPGPKVMLINETAGSGGDFLPWLFRQLKVGTLIGKRTWGGLVGILGFPVLMDGGYVTAPNLAIWTEDGFIVENVGIPPDIEVEQWPKDVIRGKDPQLEMAIKVVMEQLKENPVKKWKRPPYPKR